MMTKKRKETCLMTGRDVPPTLFYNIYFFCSCREKLALVAEESREMDGKGERGSTRPLGCWMEVVGRLS
jgi:hypothetical protein